MAETLISPSGKMETIITSRAFWEISDVRLIKYLEQRHPASMNFTLHSECSQTLPYIPLTWDLLSCLSLPGSLNLPLMFPLGTSAPPFTWNNFSLHFVVYKPLSILQDIKSHFLQQALNPLTILISWLIQFWLPWWLLPLFSHLSMRLSVTIALLYGVTLC